MDVHNAGYSPVAIISAGLSYLVMMSEFGSFFGIVDTVNRSTAPIKVTIAASVMPRAWPVERLRKSAR
jgi:hypothetical protein